MHQIFLYQFTLQSVFDTYYFTLSLYPSHEMVWEAFNYLAPYTVGKQRSESLYSQRLNWSLRFPCRFIPQWRKGAANDLPVLSHCAFLWKRKKGIKWGKWSYGNKWEKGGRGRRDWKSGKHWDCWTFWGWYLVELPLSHPPSWYDACYATFSQRETTSRKRGCWGGKESSFFPIRFEFRESPPTLKGRCPMVPTPTFILIE